MFDLPEFIRLRAIKLHALQNQIDELNAAKSAVFKSTKQDSSKLIADGLKIAFGIPRIDPFKRAEKMAIDDQARNILAILIGDTRVADNDSGKAAGEMCQKTGEGFEEWRAARDAERATSFPKLLTGPKKS